MTLLLAMAVAALILGTFLEAVPNMYVTIPLVFPVAVAMHIDLMQLYVVAGVFIGIGLLTPPVCVGAYTAAAVAQESPQNVLRKSVPYVRFGFDRLRTRIYFCPSLLQLGCQIILAR